MPTKRPAPRYVSLTKSLEDEIWQLKNDLFVARQALVSLLDTQDLLSGYFGCKDFDQVDEWRRERASVVIEAAWVRPGAEMGDPRWPRAICPLCRQGAQGMRDVRGYVVPDGLRRHLLGELNSRQCPVFAAAEQIARDGAIRHRDG